MQISFHPQAEQELEEAIAWYDGLSRRLGNEFLGEVEKALDRIVAFPEAWASLSPNTRRCRLNKFPYGVVYRVVPEMIQVIAIMHLHRNPGYWIGRIERGQADED